MLLTLELPSPPDTEQMMHVVKVSAYIHRVYGLEPHVISKNHDGNPMIFYRNNYGGLLLIEVNSICQLHVIVSRGKWSKYHDSVEYFVDKAVAEFLSLQDHEKNSVFQF